MKAFLMSVVLVVAGVTSANAKCVVALTADGQTESFVAPMLPVVDPRADIASYVYEGTVSDFALRLVEVDGFFFVNVQSPSGKLHEGPLEAIELEANHAGQTLKVTCEY